MFPKEYLGGVGMVWCDILISSGKGRGKNDRIINGSKKSAVCGVLCEGSKQSLDMCTYNDWGVLQEDGKIAIWVVKVDF